jgi:hypothetical protein
MARTYDTIIEITPTKLLAWGVYGEEHWPGSEVLRIWPLSAGGVFIKKLVEMKPYLFSPSYVV